VTNNNWDDDDEYTETSRSESRTQNSEIASLRQEIAELKGMLTDRLDLADEVAVRSNRASETAKAERAANAVAAASDSSTLNELNAINSEAELIRFMADRGYSGGQL